MTLLDKQVRQEWIDVLYIIFDLAKEQGLSWSDLAKRAEISHTTVSNYYYEKFKFGPSGPCIAKLMYAVGVDWSNFLEAGMRVPGRKRAA